MKRLKRRKRAFIISLIIFCLLLITVTALAGGGPTFLGRAFVTVTSPVQSGLTGTGNWLGERLGYFRGMAALYEENRRLTAENALLVMENSLLRYLEEAVEEYAMLLDTQLRYSNYDTMVAQVRASDPGNWYNRFIIDRGSSHGIEVNMPVLANGALIGRISKTWPYSALVESIIDDGSGVSAKVYRTNHVGVVRGDVELMMEGLVRMGFTSLGVDVAVGDEIQTSQLSSYYPPGITIGHVVSVEVDSRGIASAIVQPTADFSPVKSVLVITELFYLEYGDW
ncbi:MAG: rod shape-determining protein MreC [Defluviitaleaceae bacterium]|nr:rod shape-determining protein MreC [Defluviitaleaceae bacterium]MCL2835538.1 rod shape-determining protein MreC [Defluviitaleaceae bacterium]